jgi:hypothetical protein
MRQALLAAAFCVLRLLWVAGWLWLEFLHTVSKESRTCSNWVYFF